MGPGTAGRVTSVSASVPDHITRSPFRTDLLAGKVAIVTGGGTGIGKEIALELAGCGATLALCGRRPEPIAEVKRLIEARGGVCLAMPCDIREQAQVLAFVAHVHSQLGRIDILVNNAGGQKPFPASEMPLENFEKVIRNNLVGTFSMTQAVAKAAMIPQRHGVIVNIIAEIYRGFPGMAHTGAARAGVDNLTKSLAIEWAMHKIRINAVAPGIIRTSGTDRYPPELLDVSRKATPWRRLGTPEEVAHLVTFLASPAADFITGATYYIDGGFALWGDMFQIPDTP